MRVSTKKIVLCGLMIALSIVLGYFSFFLTPSVKISFKDIPIVMASLYGGPLVGMLCGFLADFISARPWLPQLSVAPLLMGLLPYLLIKLFPKSCTRHRFWQLLVVVMAANIAGPIVLTTILLSDLYGTPLWVLFAARAPQYLIMAALEAVILYKLLPFLEAERDFPKRMRYEEAIEYIHAIYWKGSKMGLSRTQELLRNLGDPQNKLKFVHVAGTNGKGSTCAMLSSVLCRAGYRVGLYTSPYITRFNERMQINNVPISDRRLAALVSKVRVKAEQMKDLPTEFELITAIAMQYFFEERCDIVVLEVGLGGEFDSTNVIETPLAAVICAMGYDHTAILGSTMEQIAAAKAGIIKEGGDVIIYGGDRTAYTVFANTCLARHATLSVTDFSILSVTSYGLHGQTFDYADWHGLCLNLLGSYQAENAALVLNTLRVLAGKGFPVSEDDVRYGLSHTSWPARFELLHEDPVVFVDGGHNPHGIAGTVKSLVRLFPGQKFIFVLGVMADKDVDGILDLLLPVAERFYTVKPSNDRAMDSKALYERIQSRGGNAFDCSGVREGVVLALSETEPSQVVCAVGSLYMAGEIREYVKEYYHG